MKMERIEQTLVEISMLRCSDAFEARLGKPHVARLAESIRDVGLIHPPVVRASDMQVVAGEDRVAAHCLLNRDEVLVDMVDCTDEEVELIRAEENDKRRSPQEIKALVDDLEIERALMPADASDTWRMANGSSITFFGDPGEYKGSDGALMLTDDGEGGLIQVSPTVDIHGAPESLRDMEIVDGLIAKPKRGPGRPRKPRTDAIEQAAAKLGTTPNAIRKKLDRADESAPPFETWGRTPDAKLVEAAATTYQRLTKAYGHVQTAMRSITALHKSGAIQEQLGNEAWTQLQSIAHELKASRPCALCAWCKGVPKVQNGCSACGTMGYLREGQVALVPEELKDARVVMVAGRKTVEEVEPELGI